ncbi:9741_t:CDS:1, partial [Funneliformis geosporum]
MQDFNDSQNTNELSPKYVNNVNSNSLIKPIHEIGTPIEYIKEINKDKIQESNQYNLSYSKNIKNQKNENNVMDQNYITAHNSENADDEIKGIKEQQLNNVQKLEDINHHHLKTIQKLQDKIESQEVKLKKFSENFDQYLESLEFKEKVIQKLEKERDELSTNNLPRNFEEEINQYKLLYEKKNNDYNKLKGKYNENNQKLENEIKLIIDQNVKNVQNLENNISQQHQAEVQQLQENFKQTFKLKENEIQRLLKVIQELNQYKLLYETRNNDYNILHEKYKMNKQKLENENKGINQYKIIENDIKGIKDQQLKDSQKLEDIIINNQQHQMKVQKFEENLEQSLEHKEKEIQKLKKEFQELNQYNIVEFEIKGIKEQHLEY